MFEDNRENSFFRKSVVIAILLKSYRNSPLVYESFTVRKCMLQLASLKVYCSQDACALFKAQRFVIVDKSRIMIQFS